MSIETLILPLALTVAACVGPSREEVLEPLVGQDIDAAIETPGLAIGPPAGAQ